VSRSLFLLLVSFSCMSVFIHRWPYSPNRTPALFPLLASVGTPGSLWALGADGAYSTLTGLVALPRLRRDMRSASRSASRDRSERADGSGEGSGSDGSADGSGSDGSADGSADGSDDISDDSSDDGGDWLYAVMSAGGPSRQRSRARRERQARMRVRTARYQTPPPATTDAGSSAAGRTTKRQKITRSGCSF
jgi:hypothetical protein